MQNAATRRPGVQQVACPCRATLTAQRQRRPPLHLHHQRWQLCHWRRPIQQPCGTGSSSDSNAPLEQQQQQARPDGAAPATQQDESAASAPEAAPRKRGPIYLALSVAAVVFFAVSNRWVPTHVCTHAHQAINHAQLHTTPTLLEFGHGTRSALSIALPPPFPPHPPPPYTHTECCIRWR